MTGRFARYGPIAHREVSFSPGEYERRLSAVREGLRRAELDVLITFSPSNITYLCGHSSVNIHDYQCLMVPQLGEPVMVLWYFELGRFHVTATGVVPEAYDTGEDPIRFTVDTVRKHGWLGQRIGVDGGSTSVPPVIIQRLLEALSGPSPRLVAGIVERVRLIKSAAEVDLMRRVGLITAAGVEAAVGAIRVGISDFEVVAETNRALLAAGSVYMSAWPFVCAGWRGGTPHSNASGHTLALGETVFLEMGGTVARYTTPIMRTVSLGPPSPEVTRLVQASMETLDAVIRAMRPGVPASEVAAAGERVVSKVARDVIFHYTFGYPVGLGYPPSWMEESEFLILRNNPEPLQAGMVFHLPLSLRVYGKLGVAFSETVHLTAKGVEILTESIPRQLFIK